MRLSTTRNIHEGLSHCGRDKMLSALQTRYWWPHQRATITQVLASCPMCQLQRPYTPTPEPPRHTTSTTAPGQGWSVDLAGPFPPDHQGNNYLAVAVDTHTKWVEAAPIPSKHSFNTARWFYKDIIARWGKPVFIRRDNGTEWLGDFE